MVPTSSEYVGNTGVLVIMSTEPTPQMALSISPRVNAVLREKIRAAVLRAGTAGDGAQALHNTGFDHFDATTSAIYANQARILKEYWGYKR